MTCLLVALEIAQSFIGFDNFEVKKFDLDKGPTLVFFLRDFTTERTLCGNVAAAPEMWSFYMPNQFQEGTKKLRLQILDHFIIPNV